jgi:hypothetical protein
VFLVSGRQAVGFEFSTPRASTRTAGGSFSLISHADGYIFPALERAKGVRCVVRPKLLPLKKETDRMRNEESDAGKGEQDEVVTSGEGQSGLKVKTGIKAGEPGSWQAEATGGT